MYTLSCAGPHKLISCMIPFELYTSVTHYQCCRHQRQAAVQSNMWICTSLQSASNSKPSTRYGSSVKSLLATKHYELMLAPLNPGKVHCATIITVTYCEIFVYAILSLRSEKLGN